MAAGNHLGYTKITSHTLYRLTFGFLGWPMSSNSETRGTQNRRWQLAAIFDKPKWPQPTEAMFGYTVV